MAALVAVTLISGCTSAEGASLYDRGLRLVEKMDAMAESESYWNMMTSSQETSEIIKEIGAGDYSSPRAVYEVRVSKETRELLVDFLGGESSFSQLPEEIREELDRRLAQPLPPGSAPGRGRDPGSCQRAFVQRSLYRQQPDRKTGSIFISMTMDTGAR